MKLKVLQTFLSILNKLKRGMKMKKDKINHIPNTFAPRVRNKLFSLYGLYFMISRGYIKHKQVPKQILQIYLEYGKIRYAGKFIRYEQIPKETRQMFWEYLQSEKAYSTEIRNELK